MSDSDSLKVGKTLSTQPAESPRLVPEGFVLRSEAARLLRQLADVINSTVDGRYVAEAAALKAERDNAHSEAVAKLDAQVEALCDAWRGDIRAHQDQCPATFSNCVPDDCGCGLTEKREAEIKKIKETEYQ